LKRKNELSSYLIGLIQKLRNDNIFVIILRLGENYALEKAYKDEKLYIRFEYTGPQTPQRNGKVERKFQTLYGRIRAKLNDAGVDGDFREGLWTEYASTATENLIVDKENKKDPNNLMINKLSKKAVKLRKFGEMCVITTKDKIQSKLADKGTICIFVGYGIDHASAEQIITSRDVVWLVTSFGTWTNSQNGVKSYKIDNSDSEEEIQKDTKIYNEVKGIDKKKLVKARREVLPDRFEKQIEFLSLKKTI
jgi:hypothetical protein